MSQLAQIDDQTAQVQLALDAARAAHARLAVQALTDTKAEKELTKVEAELAGYKTQLERLATARATLLAAAAQEITDAQIEAHDACRKTALKHVAAYRTAAAKTHAALNAFKKALHELDDATEAARQGIGELAALTRPTAPYDAQAALGLGLVARLQAIEHSVLTELGHAVVGTRLRHQVLVNVGTDAQVTTDVHAAAVEAQAQRTLARWTIESIPA